MKKNTLVKFIGGKMSKVERTRYPFKINEIYTVNDTCQAEFNGKWTSAIKIKEIGPKTACFPKSMFVEVDSLSIVKSSDRLKEATVDTLKDLLNEAVVSEEYDIAIVLRDEIKRR